MRYLKILILIVFLISIQFFNNFNQSISLEVNSESNIIDIKNSSIITKNNKSIFKAILINNSNKDVYISNIEMIVKDSSNITICTFIIDINKKIKITEKLKIEKEVNYDLSDSISFDYIINN